MKIKMLTASLFIASTLFTACKKETTLGNTASFTYRLQTTNPIANVLRLAQSNRVQGVNIQWASGAAAATMLKFEAENNGSEVEYKQKMEQVLDLFATNSVLGDITIPAGTYNEVEFKAFLAPSGSTPALQLNGSFGSGTATTPIQFVVATNVELKAEKHNVSVAEGSRYSAQNNLDLSELTRDITASALASATLTNGVIVLSSSSNTGIYNIMLNNLQSHHGEAEVEHH